MKYYSFTYTHKVHAQGQEQATTIDFDLEINSQDELVKALALVSPILSHSSPLESYVKPKLLLWGSQDLALPAADLKSFTEELPEPKQYEVFPGADHFWWGYEDRVASKIAAFLADALKLPSQD